LPSVWAFAACAATTPAADFCRTVRVNLHPQSRFRDMRQTSRDKTDRLRRATAGSTTSALDGDGLRCQMPARPAPQACYPVLVHRLASLLHASFRPRLATTPLRFANPSPPSGWVEDLHLQAVVHARHTVPLPRWRGGGMKITFNTAVLPAARSTNPAHRQ